MATPVRSHEARISSSTCFAPAPLPVRASRAMPVRSSSPARPSPLFTLAKSSAMDPATPATPASGPSRPPPGMAEAMPENTPFTDRAAFAAPLRIVFHTPLAMPNKPRSAPFTTFTAPTMPTMATPVIIAALATRCQPAGRERRKLKALRMPLAPAATLAITMPALESVPTMPLKLVCALVAPVAALRMEAPSCAPACRAGPSAARMSLPTFVNSARISEIAARRGARLPEMGISMPCMTEGESRSYGLS